MSTKIEWTNATWNPIHGCTHVGTPGCNNCYAAKFAKRLQAMGVPGYQNGFDITAEYDKWDQPEHWKNPRMIFVCSMGDLFHPEVPAPWINNVIDTIERTPRHTYQILTKRPAIAVRYFQTKWIKPLPSNLWFGVTAENQEWLIKRWRIIQDLKAAVKFVSIEPMLERIDFREVFLSSKPDWVIAGCETGPGARMNHLADYYDLAAQCKEFDIPLFIKKLPGEKKAIKFDEFPKVLRIRQYPRPKQNYYRSAGAMGVV